MPINVCPPNNFNPLVRATFDLPTNTICLPAGTVLLIDPNDFQRHPQSNFNKVRAMIEKGDIAIKENEALVTQVPLDLSPSAACVLLTGQAGNGWHYWQVSEANHPQLGQEIDVLRNGGPNLVNQPPVAVFAWDNLLLNINQAGFYGCLQSHFEGLKRFQEIQGPYTLNKKLWPKGTGVYVVWKSSESDPDSIVYVGSTGKFKQKETFEPKLNGGCLSKRPGRSHPYCFQSQGLNSGFFEYDPMFRVNVIKKKDHKERYRCKIPLARIKVGCFDLSGIERHISPALLEALILQNHVAIHNRLPPANNQL
jgi:hypothetical protein